ncbi:YvrJ family protein [Megamonas funiformis]
MEYIFSYIVNYGFPMVVASFLLFRMDKHLANLEEGIRRMNETLAKQVNH